MLQDKWLVRSTNCFGSNATTLLKSCYNNNSTILMQHLYWFKTAKSENIFNPTTLFKTATTSLQHCHNFPTTLLQHFHNIVVIPSHHCRNVVITLSQHCDSTVVTLPQCCHNIVATFCQHCCNIFTILRRYRRIIVANIVTRLLQYYSNTVPTLL